MAFTGTPVTFTATAFTLGGVEFGHTDGGTITCTTNISGTTVRLPVNGAAPYVITVVAGEIGGTISLEYVADVGTAIPQPNADEAAFVVQTVGFELSCQVVIQAVTFTNAGADVLKVTVTLETSGEITLDENAA